MVTSADNLFVTRGVPAACEQTAAGSPAPGRAFRRLVPFGAVTADRSAAMRRGIDVRRTASGVWHRGRGTRGGGLRMRVHRRAAADIRLRDMLHRACGRRR